MSNWAEDVVAHYGDARCRLRSRRVQMSAKIVGVATPGRPSGAAPGLRRQEDTGLLQGRRALRVGGRRHGEVRQGASVELRCASACSTSARARCMVRPRLDRCLFGWYEDEADVAARLDAYRQRRTGKVEHLRHQVQGGTYQMPSDEEIAEAMLRRAAEGRTNRPRERREEGGDMPRGSKVNEVKRAQIEEMLRAGKSHREITQALACSSSTIDVVRKATGLIGRVGASVAQEAEAAGSPPHPHQEAKVLIEVPRQITIGPPISPVPLGHHPQRECLWIRQAITRLREMPLGDYLSQTPEVRAAIDVLARIGVE